MKITDNSAEIREISLDPGETLTQTTIVNAMLSRNLHSKKRIETFTAEMFDALESHAFEQRHLAASTAP